MPGGDLLVGDTSRVNRYNKTTLAFVGTFITPGSGGIANPGQSIFGPDGNFYVADSAHSQILRFDGSTGAFLNVFVSGIPAPRGMTFGNDGRFYAVSAPAFFSCSVQRYNGTTGAFIDTFLAPNANDYPTAYYVLTAANVPEPASVGMIAIAALFALSRRHRGTAALSPMSPDVLGS
jgi:hypothetical protein